MSEYAELKEIRQPDFETEKDLIVPEEGEGE